MTTTTDIRATPSPSPERNLPQYRLRGVLGVWAAATVPMSVLGWIVAPWLGDRIGARDPFIESLLICFTVGLLWMLALVVVLVRREQGSCAWATMRAALWLGAPRNPRSGRTGGRVWWWVLAFTALSAAVNLLPIDPLGPLPRDFPHAILTDRVEHYFAGNWGGFALLVVNALLAPVVEELLFRGLLLPRMRAVFGRGDFLANGILFTLYHLHQPWSMPVTLIDGVVNQAYATRRFRSTWMGLITHTAPSVLTIAVVLHLVLSARNG
ncbi:MAG TPA: type II CAAX endopeptidase family protein [Streptomyces sp.]|nr:type II CAAX endopeptidase family protein [Streptomyces sp.]